MYVMTKSGKISAYMITDWLIKTGSVQYQCQMSIYYEYAPDETNIVV